MKGENRQNIVFIDKKKSGGMFKTDIPTCYRHIKIRGQGPEICMEAKQRLIELKNNDILKGKYGFF